MQKENAVRHAKQQTTGKILLSAFVCCCGRNKTARGQDTSLATIPRQHGQQQSPSPGPTSCWTPACNAANPRARTRTVGVLVMCK